MDSLTSTGESVEGETDWEYVEGEEEEEGDDWEYEVVEEEPEVPRREVFKKLLTLISLVQIIYAHTLFREDSLKVVLLYSGAGSLLQQSSGMAGVLEH